MMSNHFAITRMILIPTIKIKRINHLAIPRTKNLKRAAKHDPIDSKDTR